MKMDLKHVVCERVNWIQLAQDMAHSWARTRQYGILPCSGLLRSVRHQTITQKAEEFISAAEAYNLET